ncbi:MAG TPA: response regulator [Candidatus Paceibacterota bacterium]|nr:response regulator [Candidatus Paceibacterota bacterium]
MPKESPLVLLVDDEPDVLAVYKTKLERNGLKVITAANGEEAVITAQKEKPDLILMDMKMPVMDGITAQQKIKNNPDTKDLKVVFLTAFSDPMRIETDMALAKEAGALDFIKKGINLDEFAEKVKGYLK